MSKCLQEYVVHITVHVSRTAVFHDDSLTNRDENNNSNTVLAVMRNL